MRSDHLSKHVKRHAANRAKGKDPLAERNRAAAHARAAAAAAVAALTGAPPFPTVAQQHEAAVKQAVELNAAAAEMQMDVTENGAFVTVGEKLQAISTEPRPSLTQIAIPLQIPEQLVPSESTQTLPPPSTATLQLTVTSTPAVVTNSGSPIVVPSKPLAVPVSAHRDVKPSIVHVQTLPTSGAVPFSVPIPFSIVPTLTTIASGTPREATSTNAIPQPTSFTNHGTTEA